MPADHDMKLGKTALYTDTFDKPVDAIDRLSDGGSSSYYKLPRDCKELQDVMWGQDMSFSQGNIFKAAYRWDKKPDLEYNLRKIIWFANYELEKLYADMRPSRERS